MRILSQQKNLVVAELLQHILSLPQAEQLAIVQAIVSNLQSQDSNSAELLAKQFEYAEGIANALDAKQMEQIPLSDFHEELPARSLKRNGA